MLPDMQLRHVFGTIHCLSHLRKGCLAVCSQQVLACGAFFVFAHSQFEVLHIASFGWYTDSLVAACFVLDFHRHHNDHCEPQSVGKAHLNSIQKSSNFRRVVMNF
jgi:hypothetical protein